MPDTVPAGLPTGVLAAFVGLLAFFLVLESGGPRTAYGPGGGRRTHVLRHLGLFALNALLVDGMQSGWLPPALLPLPDSYTGPLLARLALPLAVQVALGVLLLDVADYFWHRLCHRVPWLWRLHRVHHSDPHLDASTGMRFHPLEALGTAALNIVVLTLLGLPAWIELVRALVANTLSFAQHADLVFPAWVERGPRALLITPELHRLHHAPLRADHDSNYGQIFSFWDRLFGSFRPPAGPTDRTGLAGLDIPPWQTVGGMLTLPFRNPPTN